MKVDTKKIGKIQITIGIILLLAVVIGTPVFYRLSFLNPLVEGSTTIVETWGEISESMNETSILPGLVTSDFVLIGTIIKTSRAVFFSVSIMLFFLSIMFILQGLANIKRK